jgi:transcription antitermination protein NusB
MTDSASQTPTGQQPTDPRHLRRASFMQQVFAYSFYTEPEQQTHYAEEHPELLPIVAQLSELDGIIQQFAPERPLSQINKVDLAILRSIMFEWKSSQTPKKVLIDEAVELAKEYGTESSPRFVNGVLAQLLKE